MKKLLPLFLFIIAFADIFCQSYQDLVFTNYFKMDGNGWNASDGTSSVALPDGRTLWMFGDSHIDQGVDSNNKLPCLFNARNSIMIQDASNNFTTYYDQSGTDVYTRQYIKMDGESEVTYWPAGGFVQNDIAYLFWNRYEQDIDAPLGIVFGGMVIAEISLPTIELINITPLENSALNYGMAVITDEVEGYHYIYGRIEDGIFTKPVVARCPKGGLGSNWDFFEGDGLWGSDASKQKAIADIVSPEFSVFQHNNKYYLLSQQLGFLQCGEGRDIYIYESENPQGPFENPLVVYTVEDQFNGEYPRTYNAQAHPQFIENNELLISYNINKTCPSPCADMPFTSRFDADMYRPKFARIPLSMFVTSSISTFDNSGLQIFPNPTSELLNIKIENADFRIIAYQLFNSFGTLAKEGVLSSSGTLKMDTLPKGVYILDIRMDQSKISRRVVKL